MRVLKKFISELGHETSTVSSVDELVDEKFKNGARSDVIMVDLDVKQEIKDKTVKKIRECCPGVDVLVISSIIPPRTASGVPYWYVRKPFRLEDLKLILAEIEIKRSSSLPKPNHI